MISNGSKGEQYVLVSDPVRRVNIVGIRHSSPTKRTGGANSTTREFVNYQRILVVISSVGTKTLPSYNYGRKVYFNLGLARGPFYHNKC